MAEPLQAAKALRERSEIKDVVMELSGNLISREFLLPAGPETCGSFQKHLEFAVVRTIPE